MKLVAVNSPGVMNILFATLLTFTKKKKIPCNPDINGNQCNKEGISPGMKTVIDWNNLFWQGDKGETINCSRTSRRVELEEIILL